MAQLPRRIQQQVEAAEALIAQANAPAPSEASAVADQPPQEPQQQEPPAPVVAEAPPQVAPEPEETWEQRYRSLQGRFNSQVPVLQQQTKELSAQLQQVQADLEKQRAQQAPAEQKPSLDPKDIDAFGADLVEMVQRVTQSVLGSMAARIDQTVTAFESRLTQVERSLDSTSKVVSRSAEEAFFDRLATAVPDWENVNASQAFLTWLGEVDPVYGQPRQVALDSAQAALNPDRAVAVFNAFKATLAKPAPKADPLSKQVSPRSSASSAPTPTEKPVLSEKQVTDFYADVARGRYRGRDAEVAEIEQTINLAIAEGRVR